MNFHREDNKSGRLTTNQSAAAFDDRALPDSMSVHSLYKAECVNFEGPWRTVEELELATLLWIDWYNPIRLHSSIDYTTPAAYEQTYWQTQTPATQTV